MQFLLGHRAVVWLVDMDLKIPLKPLCSGAYYIKESWFSMPLKISSGISDGNTESTTCVWWCFDWSELLHLASEVGLVLTSQKRNQVWCKCQLDHGYLLTVCWFSTLILAFLKQPWTRNAGAVSVTPQWSLHSLNTQSSRRARFSLGIWEELAANRLLMFASSPCTSWNSFKRVPFENHYVKRCVLIAEPRRAQEMSVLLGAPSWHLATFCQVTCLTAVLGCVLPATGLTTIMKPITVTGN